MKANENTIGKFRIGTVVKALLGLPEDNEWCYGHVTGFDTNPLNEVIIVIKFANYGEKKIHPTLLGIME